MRGEPGLSLVSQQEATLFLLASPSFSTLPKRATPSPGYRTSLDSSKSSRLCSACPPGRQGVHEGGRHKLPSWHTPAPTFGCELRRFRAEVPEADSGVSRAARQVPERGGTAQHSVPSTGQWQLLPRPDFPPYNQTLVLSRGAESHGDDGLGVSLEGAGAARHRPHPEHRLRLVDDVQDLLCLHALPCQGLLQRRHDLGIVDEESQRYRLILREKGQVRQ